MVYDFMDGLNSSSASYCKKIKIINKIGLMNSSRSVLTQQPTGHVIKIPFIYVTNIMG